ncbi:MAG: omptin family outer membrane protease, partial [Thermodesulfovibrionales bacterium]
MGLTRTSLLKFFQRQPVSAAPFLLFLFLSGANSASADDLAPLTEPFPIEVKTKHLFSSHSSYEFGNPFPPYQAPLSRLEFPLNASWVGIGIKARLPRFSLGLEALTNDKGDVAGRMRDSDWDDDERPDLRTIYSESKCRIERSLMVTGDMDLEVSDWLGLPQWLSLRPVAGLRRQSFRFVTHDGVQYELSEGNKPLLLPGNGIRFSQRYNQYFIGLRSNLSM